MAEHFHALEVAEVVPETDDAMSIRFRVPPELAATFQFKAGQHLTLMGMIGDEEVRRNYSLCTAPADDDLMVTVKRIAGGVFSNWVGDQLKPGDRSTSCRRTAASRCSSMLGRRKQYVALCRRVGDHADHLVDPHRAQHEPDSRFTLFYGNRDSNSVIFLDALADLKDRYIGRFELYHFLCR